MAEIATQEYLMIAYTVIGAIVLLAASFVIPLAVLAASNWMDRQKE